MDLWVVAVAASAGCLAKYLRNLSSDGNSLPELSPGDRNCRKPKFPDCSSHRFAHRKKLGDHISKERKGVSDGRLSDVYRVDGALAAEVASTSGSDVERLGCIDIYEDRNVLSVSSIPPRCPTNDDIVEHEAGNRSSGDIGDNSAYTLRVPSAGMCSFHGSSRSSLRTKRSYGHFIKPLSSSGSCLVAQLCKEHAEMENYIFSSLPSPSTQSMGPLFVTDGSGILSIANAHFQNAQIGFEEDKVLGEACFVKNENMYGIPLLPTIGSLEFLTKMKKSRTCGSGRLSSSIKMVGGKHIHARSQEGSPDGIILFGLGIYLGIISSIMTNKREVDNLKELLKQTQNFVQDLQDELEMKDSVVVKELDNENYKSQNPSDNSYDMALTTVSTEPHTSSTKYADKKIYDWTVEESSEPMSKIEAELEMLELNINASSLDRRLSDLVELDLDFVADFAQGELRADMINDRAAQPKSNEDARDTSTPHSGNYSVSPRELSLRLHEVIQSRLEDRVLELETALQNSQRKLNLMQSRPANSWKEFSRCERDSSVRESSIAQKCNPLAQPLFLDADSEAYIDLVKTDDSEYQVLPSRVYENMHQKGFNQLVEHAYKHQNGGMGGSKPHLTIDDGMSSLEFFSSKRRAFDLKDVGVDEDGKNDWDDDEIEQQ
ncbi:uncharacterized protein LOC121236932 isoform X2 [Juglans microcarpa x Juglans regia]|uniref:uncharacterized protein LOC121236932 isoform X2 n=1 Tax=Juglans microcarpa x Juglans regia TaxID=2249226 RepID=UPI001B7E038A|nr:uncharacterized protein LOC121236932 isoform X2 [Juglans microcarpa x Juglans regia]XP_040989385.1 uncharacterized protein LOC121236932 isoform X2 [Juglans microcarpa x Juglans regia]